MSVSIKKIEGVESVNVSLNQGSANIRLQPANTVRIEQILRAVTNNGFTPKEAKISAVGTVLSTEAKLKFQIAGTNQSFDVLFDTAVKDISDAVRKEVGKTIVVDGVITLNKDKIPQTVIVKSVKQADARTP